LENHGYERFSQIYLGEFDTPEAIWNSEMRRHMIEKIAGHLADFSPRLQSNIRALYQYCPIPIVAYPQLESELFCDIYYLRHLCDEKRFGDWPVKEPVRLLKECLMAWKVEVDKRPPTMSRGDAYDILELKTASDRSDENKVRKAYFKLAQKYHPDKNPDGREMFEKVNKAYEFLCSAAKIKDGPDPENIALILKAQCILFKRYSDVLSAYKYAGYPMLIKTIQMETNDEQLFSKKNELLTNAAELAYQTIRCSALNAEELRRELGLEALTHAFNRCVTMLSVYSKDASAADGGEISVHVCLFITQCFGAAAQFEMCREKMLTLPGLVKDLCRCLYFKNLPRLCLTSAEAVSAFGPDKSLQAALFEHGILVHLLSYMFNYDFTLEEGGVERANESNQQETANSIARVCVKACARLAGFSGYYLSEEEQQQQQLPQGSTSGALPGGQVDKNNRVMQALVSLVTPYLARNISMSPPEILKLMNSNSQTPYLIWDNATRAELRAYLENEREHLYKKGECADQFLGSRFRYSILEKELVIGDIYVRIYNEQPTYPLEEPKKFCIDLLDFLGSHAQYLYSMLLSGANSTVIN